MQIPSKQKAWANDDVQLASNSTSVVQPVEEVVIPEGESDDEYQVLSKKAKTVEQKLLPEVERVVEAEPVVPEANVAQNRVDMSEELPAALAVEAGPVTDADWLRSRTNRVLDLVEDDDDIPPPPPVAKEDTNMTEDQPEAEAEVAQPEAVPAEEAQDEDAAPTEEDKVRQTGRLFLRNLHYDITEDDIREQFAKFGTLEEVGFQFFLTAPRHMMNIKIGTTDA
jgi:multiple RNA-binding domain-containing protein 1